MMQRFAVGDRVIALVAQAAGVPVGTVGTVVQVFARLPELCDVQFDDHAGVRAVLASALDLAPDADVPRRIVRDAALGAFARLEEVRMATKLVISTLTCPVCWVQSTRVMPTDACVIVAKCRSCGHSMRPKPGDCCVFCSYGDIPCPPIQCPDCTGADSGNA
jgi:hypothetical protein